ncbi:ADP-ribosylglycohydrolase family protein [Lactonifactor longoviformis]|uniref:ADP-ribosylglycohydrolase n=1 Tax=Lactonifactor longoviformis DSM 17459 TaxID=1122155 RepID=A0A1M4U2Y4_9CLOT|nr:ADP-ribosylglycohydrolase family protein [Lactonifactor longoviformis]POP32848.1 ADP-ribosylglycohydrolase family protein [Lactonifactor longoviformis]SHE50877.1 ADP-ribosylglycohydrolase [Lactonifactor longoviformis DSM 17459]
MEINRIKEDIYAGVLGKMIGVYLGRPVEGWTYEKIQKHFGEIYYYKNHKTGAPLIVPDDDISGTFAFFRSLEDNGYDPELTAEAIGDTWLNYIIENQTILWWGGLARSTEHTAYLRLKNGIKAPKSGSVELNGRSMAEQIGSEIFIDTWALANPGNPERTARMAKAAASVSHGGVAIDAAVYLAVMESMAFEEKNIDALLDGAMEYVDNREFKELVQELRAQCAGTDDWHQVRRWIAENHGYEKYPGNCPMITNHLVVLMALLMGGDDFHKSCMIACSSGWDTDCNSGNVGCLNGIRLGLKGFQKGNDLRKAVADRMYIVTSDGGSCISDAVLETRKIVKAAAALNGEEIRLPRERMAFEYPGSVQGIIPYDKETEEQVLTRIENTFESDGEYGCRLSYERLGAGVHASACVDTFVDLKPKGKDGTSYFDVLCSPTLYSGQTVSASVKAEDAQNPDFRFFIEYFNEEDELEVLKSDGFALEKGENLLTWEVPDTEGHAIYRLGITLTSQECVSGSIILKTLDWSNVPVRYCMGRSMEMTPSLTPWTTKTSWLATFVSSADCYCPDYTTTFSISHSGHNGVVTTGTLDWDNYSVSSALTLGQQDAAGLVARAKGHRRYYGAVLTNGQAVIYRQKDGERTPVASESFDFESGVDHIYNMKFTVNNDTLTLYVDGKEAVSGRDSAYTCGGAGFVVDYGAILADRFEITRVKGE